MDAEWMDSVWFHAALVIPNSNPSENRLWNEIHLKHKEDQTGRHVCELFLILHSSYLDGLLVFNWDDSNINAQSELCKGCDVGVGR